MHVEIMSEIKRSPSPKQSTTPWKVKITNKPTFSCSQNEYMVISPQQVVDFPVDANLAALSQESECCHTMGLEGTELIAGNSPMTADQSQECSICGLNQTP